VRDGRFVKECAGGAPPNAKGCGDAGGAILMMRREWIVRMLAAPARALGRCAAKHVRDELKQKYG